MADSRLLQFLDQNGKRRIGAIGPRGEVRQLDGHSSVYELALASIRPGTPIGSLIEKSIGPVQVEYDELVREKRLLVPLDHPDPARCIVSLTGLTHLGSATSRDKMHAANSQQESNTDTFRMFQLGLAGGKPAAGAIGVQPEWAYKGDGRCVVAPEHVLTQPSFAEDGGEEAEIAGLYIIDDEGNPWRVGFAVGNEFSDHIMEKRNYLYLAHSKLRQCSYGPELLIGELPDDLSGTVRILRNDKPVWSSAFKTGERNMCHSIRNLEQHHFKYPMFRRPGDVHVHFFGADAVSFSSNFRTECGDVFEVDIPAMGRPLRNRLQVESGSPNVAVRSL